MKIINYKRAGQLVADDGFDTGDMGSVPRREIFGLAGIAKAFNDPPDGCRLSRSRLTLNLLKHKPAIMFYEKSSSLGQGINHVLNRAVARVADAVEIPARWSCRISFRWRPTWTRMCSISERT